MNCKKLAALIASLVLLTGCGAEKVSVSESAADTSAAQTETAAEKIPDETGTTAEADTTEAAAEVSEYYELSRQLITEFTEGSTENLYALFNTDMQNQISERDLKASWVQICMSSGKFVEMFDTSEETDGDLVTTTTRLRFENEELDLIMMFNSAGKIMGMMLTAPDDGTQEEILPEETDDFAETAMKVGEYELDGLLTVPKNTEKPPLVVLVWGSGQCDMNEAGTFYELAHGLAERGVATLRFNKRLYQFPELETEDTDVNDEYFEDVDAAIALAQSYVDSGEFSGVYVLGHSQGGSLMPSIAERNSNVRAAVSLAGTPRRLIDVWLEQLNAQLDMFEDETTVGYLETLIDQVETMRDEHILKETDNPSAYQIFFGAAYWNSLDAIDITGTAQQLDIPMLFLQGDKDVQVYPDRDYPAWQEALAGKDNCTFKLYEGLGHFFNDKNGSFDSTVMDDIADFFKNN